MPERKEQHHRGTDARRGIERDAAAVKLDQVLDDRQAKARAAMA